MHVTTIALGMLTGAGGAFGRVLGGNLSNRDLNRARDVQSSVISECHWPYPVGVNTYHVLDVETNICDLSSDSLNVQELKAGQNFEFTSYGTKCRFFIDADWAKTPVGQAFGHADCPGLQDIKGIKRDGVLQKVDDWDVKHDWCSLDFLNPFKKEVYCYSRIFLTWDGCLSCGDHDPNPTDNNNNNNNNPTKPEKNCPKEKYPGYQGANDIPRWIEENQCKDVCPDEKWGFCPKDSGDKGLCQCTDKKCTDSGLYACWVK